jgi:2,3-bisphosphoglycerate-dependent phosphoglycerate mutase
MAKVIMGFVRHGDYHQLSATPSAHQPFALTSEGIAQCFQQADKLSQLITKNDWQLITKLDSSTMLRAWQTADIFKTVINNNGLQVDSYDALAERSVGAVANLSVEQITKVVSNDPRYDDLPDNWKSDSHFRLPFQGAESLLEAGERVAGHIMQKMTEIHAGDKTKIKLFFGHGASFRHAAYHMGILDFDDIAKLSMFYAEPMLFERDELGQWSHIGGEWKQRTVKQERLD